MLKKAFSAAALVFMFAAVSAAQDVSRFDASINWGEVFSQTTRTSIGNTSVVPTNSPLLLGTLRFRFNRMHSVEANVGRVVGSQIFVLPPDNYRVQTTTLEYSGAYVFSPFHFEKLEPFVFAGGGALRFTPGNTFIDGFQSSFGAARQTGMAFLYGGGVNYPLWKRLALRLQYRGLIFKQPDFHVQQFTTGARAQMPELSIGLVVKF